MKVTRISEKVELDDDALSLLVARQLIPGSDAVVVGPAPDGVIVKTAQVSRRSRAARRPDVGHGGVAEAP